DPVNSQYGIETGLWPEDVAVSQAVFRWNAGDLHEEISIAMFAQGLCRGVLKLLPRQIHMEGQEEADVPADIDGRKGDGARIDDDAVKIGKGCAPLVMVDEDKPALPIC